MSLNWTQDIADMHKYFGVKDKTMKLSPPMLLEYLKFRFNFLQEELNEGKKAIENRNSEEIVDSLIDLCVVAIGTLDAYRVDATEAWDEVLKANMAKKVGIKESRPNPFGLADLIKPVGWQAPSHKNNHGIIPDAFTDE
jgi:predicted HAD superfamily Cof-like phosphohydrolase